MTCPSGSTSRACEVLPQADWLLLACPLNAPTRGMVDAAALVRLPEHAQVVNVSRGEIVDEPAWGFAPVPVRSAHV